MSYEMIKKIRDFHYNNKKISCKIKQSGKTLYKDEKEGNFKRCKK